MSSFNPFLNTNNNNSIFGNKSNNANIFGTNTTNNNNQTSSIFGNYNTYNNNQISSISGNNNSVRFGVFNNSISTSTNFINNNQNNNDSIFRNNNIINNNTNQSNNMFINNSNNNNSLFFQNNNNNQNNNIIGNSNNNINTNNIILNNNNNIFTLAGINSSQNNNNNNNNEFNDNFFQNQSLNSNNNKVENDLKELQVVLMDVMKCMNPSEKENMFKDYLYMPIPKGLSSNDVNVYKAITELNNKDKIVNDYNIWEEGNKNNKNPNEFFPIQISSLDALLTRNKLLEKSFLLNIANIEKQEKNMEKLNRKIKDEMSNKLIDLKNYQYKLDELELSLSTKMGQYTYLTGAAKENVTDTEEIKENIKKANENIKENDMHELCGKIKKSSYEGFTAEKRNYIKDMNKDGINTLLDGLIEIQNMMNVICNDNKRKFNIIMGAQKEFERICQKNKI